MSDAGLVKRIFVIGNFKTKTTRNQLIFNTYALNKSNNYGVVKHKKTLFRWRL